MPTFHSKLQIFHLNPSPSIMFPNAITAQFDLPFTKMVKILRPIPNTPITYLYKSNSIPPPYTTNQQCIFKHVPRNCSIEMCRVYQIHIFYREKSVSRGEMKKWNVRYYIISLFVCFKTPLNNFLTFETPYSTFNVFKRPVFFSFLISIFPYTVLLPTYI